MYMFLGMIMYYMYVLDHRAVVRVLNCLVHCDRGVRACRKHVEKERVYNLFERVSHGAVTPPEAWVRNQILICKCISINSRKCRRQHAGLGGEHVMPTAAEHMLRY
jgi:hypothetical protein